MEPKERRKDCNGIRSAGNEEAAAVKLEAEKKIVIEEKKSDPLAPKLVDEYQCQDTPMPMMNDMVETEYIKEEEPLVLWQLAGKAVMEEAQEKLPSKNTVEEGENTVGKMLIKEKKDDLYSS